MSSSTMIVAGRGMLYFSMTKGAQKMWMNVRVRKRAFLVHVEDDLVKLQDKEGVPFFLAQLNGFLVMLQDEEYGLSLVGDIVVDSGVFADEYVKVVKVAEGVESVVGRDERIWVEGKVVVHGLGVIINNALVVANGIVAKY